MGGGLKIGQNLPCIHESVKPDLTAIFLSWPSCGYLVKNELMPLIRIDPFLLIPPKLPAVKIETTPSVYNYSSLSAGVCHTGKYMGSHQWKMPPHIFQTFN